MGVSETLKTCSHWKHFSVEHFTIEINHNPMKKWLFPRIFHGIVKSKQLDGFILYMDVCWQMEHINSRLTIVQQQKMTNCLDDQRLTSLGFRIHLHVLKWICSLDKSTSCRSKTYISFWYQPNWWSIINSWYLHILCYMIEITMTIIALIRLVKYHRIQLDL